MTRSKLMRALFALTMSSLFLFSLHVRASAPDTYPSRPVTIVVGFSPGSVTDIQARVICDHLSHLLGQPFIVESLPGAGGAIAIKRVARAAADGYTLLLSGGGPLMAAPIINPEVANYDPVHDFEPVSLTDAGPYVLVIKRGRFASLADLIAKAKAAPGSITYGTSGVGSTSHLLALLFADAAGIKLRQIPYKGGVQSLTDLMGGQIDMVIEGVPFVVPYLSNGTLEPLGVTALKRSPVLPNVPTFDELGLKGYQGGTWIGVLAPLGTPSSITAALNAAIAQTMKDPEVQKAAQLAGMEARSMKRPEFAEFLKVEKQRLGDMARRAVASEQ